MYNLMLCGPRNTPFTCNLSDSIGWWIGVWAGVGRDLLALLSCIRFVARVHRKRRGIEMSTRCLVLHTYRFRAKRQLFIQIEETALEILTKSPCLTYLLCHSTLYNINGYKGVATYSLQTLSVYDVTLTSRSTVFLKKLMFIL